MKLTKQEVDDFTAYLAEGIHTAFRKGSDHPNADKVWKLIQEMPAKEWGNVIEFVMFGLRPYIEQTMLPAVMKRQRLPNK